MDTKELIKSGNEALFKGNLDIIAQLFDKDYVVHSGGKDYKGHEFIKRWVKQLRSAILDIQVEKVEILVQSDNTIVWQRTLSGTHKTEFIGIQPINKKKSGEIWRYLASMTKKLLKSGWFQNCSEKYFQSHLQSKHHL